MFDLPVVEKYERKAANDFRLCLKDMGFEMMQLSVYVRYLFSDAQVESFKRKIEYALPQDGKVNILLFTDKQFERIITFSGATQVPTRPAPEQYALF